MYESYVNIFVHHIPESLAVFASYSVSFVEKIGVCSKSFLWLLRANLSGSHDYRPIWY